MTGSGASTEGPTDRTMPPADNLEPQAADQPSAERARAPRSVLSDYGVGIFFVLLVVGFSIAEPSQFPTWSNAQTILGDQAIPGILALAVIIPLAAGEFDLSVGATLGFCSIFAAYASSKGMAVELVFVLTLLIGVAIGTFNALLVGGIGVNAFIATLGTATILSGGNLLVTNGSVIFEGVPESLTRVAQTEWLGLQLVVFYFIVLAVVAWYMMEQTPYGRYLRATGLGREAARLTGVRTGRWLRSSFVLAALLAAFAGFIQTARVGSATPSIGPEFLLPAYAAAFLGATTIKPGLFNVWGTVVGVLLLSVGITGLTIAGAPFWVPSIFNGTALVLAVSVAVLVGRRTRTHT